MVVVILLALPSPEGASSSQQISPVPFGNWMWLGFLFFWVFADSNTVTVVIADVLQLPMIRPYRAQGNLTEEQEQASLCTTQSLQRKSRWGAPTAATSVSPSRSTVSHCTRKTDSRIPCTRTPDTAMLHLCSVDEKGLVKMGALLLFPG